MFDNRASGILLHPISLPSRFGIGDLGPEAYKFVDFLSASSQQIWQILPLSPTGFGNSPYLAYSALAGNPLLISPEKLLEDGLLMQEEIDALPHYPVERIDYDLVIKTKMPLLKLASEKFKRLSDPNQWNDFNNFCEQYSYWLDDYALFMAVKEANNNESWHRWEPGISKRQPEAMEDWKNRLSDEIFHHKFMQFQFFKQWKSIKGFANEKGIQILGDIPIYVSHDSVDVWSNREIFCLDLLTGEASQMAGVPPDYFSSTGQLWGNPVYNWEKLRQDNFQWWIRRIKGMLEYVDYMRIDHFRGFQAYWTVPQGETTAINGWWQDAPGEELFNTINQELGTLPIVAEDLGLITPEVEHLRDKFNFPGMKVLHFAFDSDRSNPFLPFNYYNRNCIVYTGTHDNDTTIGWFQGRSLEEKSRVTDYLGPLAPESIHWSMIRLAMSSVANLSIVPVQDLLGLGGWAKMNCPGTLGDNWCWRYRPGELTQDLIDRLRYLTYLYGREPRNY